MIRVCCIVAYERHPRRAANPAYGRLKVAIRRDGLTQPFVVTRRPGAAGYVLWSGGATRLRIVKELATETGSAHFTAVPCLVRPWRGEAELLLAHLKEDQLRAAIDFIDLAEAVAHLRTLLEREAGETLDGRRLVRRLASLGLELDRSTVSLAIYAADRVSRALPLAARRIGRCGIERVRALDRAVRSLWREWSIDTVAEYDAVFRALCARYDGPNWELPYLDRALAEEMSVRSDHSAQAAAMEIQARLSQFRAGADNS